MTIATITNVPPLVEGAPGPAGWYWLIPGAEYYAIPDNGTPFEIVCSGDNLQHGPCSSAEQTREYAMAEGYTVAA